MISKQIIWRGIRLNLIKGNRERLNKQNWNSANERMSLLIAPHLAPKVMGLPSSNSLNSPDNHQNNKSKLESAAHQSSSQLMSENLRHSYPKPSAAAGSQGAKLAAEVGPQPNPQQQPSSAAVLRGLPADAAALVKKLQGQTLVGQSPHLRARLAEAAMPLGHPNIHLQQPQDTTIIDLEKSFPSSKMKEVGLTRTVALSQEYKPRVAAKAKMPNLTGVYNLGSSETPTSKTTNLPQSTSGSIVSGGYRTNQQNNLQYSVITQLVGQLQGIHANPSGNQAGTRSPQKSHTVNLVSGIEKEISTGALRKGSGHKLRALVGNSLAENSQKQQTLLPQLGGMGSAKEVKLFTQLNSKSNGLFGQSLQLKQQALPQVGPNIRQLEVKTYEEDQNQTIGSTSTKKIIKKEMMLSPKDQLEQATRQALHHSTNNPDQMLAAIHPRQRGVATSEGTESPPGRNVVRRITRARPPMLSKADKKANILFNLFCCLWPGSKATLAKCGIGLGNNDRLIERLLRAKGLTTETFFSKCNFIWTQGVNKRTAMVKIGTGFTEMDMRSEKTPDNIRMYKIKSADALSQQIQATKLFYVAPENLSLLREACEKTKACAKLLVIKPEEFSLMNHMKGLKYITRKHLLYQTMKEYCESNKLSVGDFVPETWVLRGDTFDADLATLLREKAAKNDGYKDPLIIKPGENSNRGQGIEMAFNAEDVKLLTSFLLESRKNTSTVVVQTYIANPLLFHKRKFDIRCYALVLRSPYRVSFFWYSQGYARTCSFEYSPACKENLMVHLTNEAVQVKDPKNFGKFEPGNKVYYDQLDEYFSTCEEFQSRKKGFIKDVVPKFKVVRGFILGTSSFCILCMCCQNRCRICGRSRI